MTPTFRIGPTAKRGLVLLALATINVLVIGLAIFLERSERTVALRDIEGAVHRALEQEVARLQTLAGLPAVVSVLGQAGRGGTSFTEGIAEIASQWPTLPRDDPAVREVLDNNVAEILASSGANPDGEGLVLLTDARGRLLAASAKPPLFLYSEQTWWKEARTSEWGRVVSEGITTSGRLGLTLPLRVKAGARTAEGILRTEIPAGRLGRLEGLPTTGRDYTVALLGRAPAVLVGSSNALANAPAQVLSGNARPGTTLRRGGWCVAVLAPPGPVRWDDLARLVVICRDPVLSWRVIGLGALSVSVTCLLACAYIFVPQKKAWDAAPAEYQELLEAGDWILHTALGRALVLRKSAKAGAAATPEVSPLQRELQQWLYRLLRDLHEEYTARSFEMERDLNLARDFQLAYMQRAYPRIPAVHVEGRLRLDFYHRYEPALALGGDFYNILTLGPDCAGVFVADVMGHGTRSALITAIIRTLIDDLASQGRNARHFLTEMNKQFCGLLKSVPHPLFASAFYFVADTTSRVATYSSAGHPAPFQVRRSVGRITRMEVPMPRGAALGMIPNETYTGGYSRLIDGDLFIFFTDGVYEAHNVQGEEFGIARMEQVIRALMYKSSKEIVDGLMDAITTFVSYEPIADDICIVAVEVTTKPATS